MRLEKTNVPKPQRYLPGNPVETAKVLQVEATRYRRLDFEAVNLVAQNVRRGELGMGWALAVRYMLLPSAT